MQSQIHRGAHGPKVLFFSTYVSYESGASHALLQTITRVEAAGIKPLVVVPDSADSHAMFPDSKFDVVYLKLLRPRRTWNPVTQARYGVSFPATLFLLRRIIRQRNVDLVHFNEITDFIAGMAAKSCGVPSVCHVRSDCPPNPYRIFLLSALRRTTDAIVVPSKSTAAWIAAAAADLSARIRLVYDYAFDVTDYLSPQSGSTFRLELGIPCDEVLVVLVSKLVTHKGHLCFIQAAEKVLKQSKGVHFVIVGGPIPGREAEASAIRNLGETLTPAPRLRFVGPRSDLPSIYAACDIAVHCPVFPDTYPTVVLLPMLTGKAVIGSHIGGIPEQIEHNRTGILVPPDDPDALAQAMMSLVRDPAGRALLGSAAMSKIRCGLVPETQGRILADLYEEMLKVNRRPAGRGREGSAKDRFFARENS
jgi:glycosyltransferase involved in cell wall biosynthesis